MAQDLEQLSLVEGEVEHQGETTLVSTRDYCRMRIRDHARRTVEEALQIGRYVSEARATFNIKKGRKRKGEPQEAYDEWLAETCAGVMGPDYAERLRLMYERQQESSKELQPESDRGIKGLVEALREEAGASKPKENGEAKSRDDLSAKLERQKELAEKRLEAKKEAEEKAKELRQKLREASAGRKEVEAQITQEVERHFLAEMAEVKSRYGDTSEPTFLDIPPEAWAVEMRKAKDQRVIDVTKMLNDLYDLPGWMGQYFPDEAADAIMDMERGEEIVEGFEFLHDWVGRLLEEVHNRAT